MKEQDRARFKANIQWFNQFFDGVHSLYEMIVSQLPTEYFPTASTITSDNYYFPRQKIVPSIPPYYALLVEGSQHSLQILTIVDLVSLPGVGSLSTNLQISALFILRRIKIAGWMSSP